MVMVNKEHLKAIWKAHCMPTSILTSSVRTTAITTMASSRHRHPCPIQLKCHIQGFSTNLELKTSGSTLSPLEECPLQPRSLSVPSYMCSKWLTQQPILLGEPVSGRGYLLPGGKKLLLGASQNLLALPPPQLLLDLGISSTVPHNPVLSSSGVTQEPL